jgi:ATP-dependent DNA helicase RecG
MNRLLQGDVGSGKTVVAAGIAALIAHHNAQSAIMAPTSILAEQHYRTFLKLLAAAEESNEQQNPVKLPASAIRLLTGPPRIPNETNSLNNWQTIRLKSSSAPMR